MPATIEELVLPYPAPLTPARHVRSTLLLGSQAALRACSRYEDYIAYLAPADREVLTSMVAGTWILMTFARAHYKACDALGLAPDQQLANGRSTFDKTSGTLLGTVIRMAKEAGMTPWSVVPQLQRFWERGYDGGAIGVWKTGPKELRMDIVQMPLSESRYYRNALRGLGLGIFQLFCTKAYVTERPGGSRAPGTVSLRCQWA